MESLELKQVGKIYPNGKEALKQVNMVLTPGVYGLLGPNGAGKSTLMKILTQNLKATTGELFCDGVPIEKLGNQYRKKIGFMPQQQTILEGFTGRRFLWYMAALKGMSRRQASLRVKEMLHVVNLEEAADKKIGSYSGGMKQRILLAQALLDMPSILVLDEPTAGLDPRERVRIRNFISEISKEKIVLIATHVVSDVECIAKEILLLKDGSVISQGTPAALQENVSGFVWENTVDTQKLKELESSFCISNVSVAGNQYRVRVVGKMEDASWQAVSPTLEDVYLYYFGNH